MELMPSEIIQTLFSHLETPKDLSHAGQVCRNWNTQHKTSILWKKHCLALLENAKEIESSWYTACKTLYNWKWGRGYVEMKYSSFPGPYDGDFVFLEDGTLIEVEAEVQSRIINIYDHKTKEMKNIHLPAAIRKACCFGNHCALITADGFVHCYDLTTLNCTRKAQVPIPLSRKPLLKLTDSEIITSYNQKIHIISLKDGTIHEIDAPYRILDLNTSANFVFYTYFHDGEWWNSAIHKESKHIKEFGFIKGLATWGSQVVIANSLGVQIFYETEKNGIATLELKNVLPHDCIVGHIQIFQNWLFCLKDHTMQIWNLTTLEKIAQYNNQRIFGCGYQRAFKANQKSLIVKSHQDNRNMGYAVISFTKGKGQKILREMME